jgi:hypothetical protein
MILLFILISCALLADTIMEKIMKKDLIPDQYRKYLYGALIVTGLIWLNPFTHNSAGERTYYQNPIFGGEGIIFEPGYHLVGPFARTQAWPDVLNTSFDKGEEVRIQFNDGTGAMAEANMRWDLPRDEGAMIGLHKAYRSPEQLEHRTLEPFGKECLNFAAQLMESETHYSGGQSKFKEDFRDQLLNGQYVLETKVDFQMDTFTKEQIKTTSAHIRVDHATGVPIRIPSDVQTYGIKCVFAAVPNVTYDSIVYMRLKSKIEQSTAESISKQRLITAQQQALTAKAEGEKRIADVRAEELALKEEAVIQAQKAKEVAKEQAAQAIFEAQKVLTEGRALAEANKLKVAAGLTPLERAQFEKETKIGVAAEMAKLRLPTTMISGGNNGAINPFDMIGLEAYYKIVDKMSKPQ